VKSGWLRLDVERKPVTVGGPHKGVRRALRGERFVARRASPVVPRGYSLDVSRVSSCVGLLVGREITLGPDALDQAAAEFQEVVSFPLSVLTAASR